LPMALLSFVDSTPRAYRLKAGNAAWKVSTNAGTSPSSGANIMNRLAVPLRWYS